MEFNYDFQRKSKHKIEKIRELIEPECMNKMNGGGAIDSKVINGEMVKTNNKKLQNYFLHDCTCEVCGRKGEFFALEKNKGSNKYFLNLYTIIDGKEVLMLKELKVPTKLGGFDIPDNWILICDKCYLEKFRNKKQERLDVNIENGYVLKFDYPILNDDLYKRESFGTDNENIIFGKRLKEEREKLGISREDFAKQMNISYSALSMYERGERTAPDILKIKISNVLGVSLDYLMGMTNWCTPIKKKYINISKNKFGQLSCTYVNDISKAKVYKNKGILKKRLNKMIELDLLPEKDIRKYEIRLKDEEMNKV